MPLWTTAIGNATSQGIARAVVETTYSDTVKPGLIHFEIGAPQQVLGEFFNRKADGIAGAGKSPVAKRLTGPFFVFSGEKLSVSLIVKKDRFGGVINVHFVPHLCE